MRNHISRLRSEKGFTLIKLLVVIVILGVLAAVVVFAVGGINNTSKDSASAIDLRTMKTAEQASYAQDQKYLPEISTDPAVETLVSKGLLDDESKNWNVDVSGAKPVYSPDAANGSKC